MKYIKKYKEQFSYLIFNLLSYNNIGDYMKVIIIDDDNIIVFLNKFNIKNIDFDSKENIEKNFRNIFLRLKHIYNLNIKGYYNINIYTDKFYGAVLEIEHEDIEYFDYFDNKVDMRVNVVSDSKFLYKIKDIFCLDKTLLNNIYLFKNDYYIELKRKISDYELGLILENSDLIYGDIVNDILKLGINLNI